MGRSLLSSFSFPDSRPLSRTSSAPNAAESDGSISPPFSSLHIQTVDVGPMTSIPIAASTLKRDSLVILQRRNVTPSLPIPYNFTGMISFGFPDFRSFFRCSLPMSLENQVLSRRSLSFFVTGEQGLTILHILVLCEPSVPTSPPLKSRPLSLSSGFEALPVYFLVFLSALFHAPHEDSFFLPIL